MSSIEQITDALNKSGLREYTAIELRALTDRLKQKIQEGIDRSDNVEPQNGDILATQTGIDPVTTDTLEAVEVGTVAVVAACGGTNWVFTTCRKNPEGEFALDHEVVVTISEEERVHTFDSLTRLIVQQLIKTIDLNGVRFEKELSIGISLGFSHTNIVLDNGDIDARIIDGNLPKKWRITDCDNTVAAEEQPSLARLIRSHLKEAGFHNIGTIAIANDTVAVALDSTAQGQGIDTLPAGFVFGTGTNASMYGNSETGLLNLESGHCVLFETDLVHEGMLKKGYFTNTVPTIEHYVGGMYVVKRFATALEVISDDIPYAQQWVDPILHSTDQALVSHLASGDMECIPGANTCTIEEKTVLQEAARRALVQAAQLMGVKIAAAIEYIGSDKDIVALPYEGSLLKKGYAVYDVAVETASQLTGKEVRLYSASGMIGIGKLAVVI